MPALGRVRFQVADDEIAIVLGTDIWWCSALSMQHPLMEFLQYCQYSTAQCQYTTRKASRCILYLFSQGAFVCCTAGPIEQVAAISSQFGKYHTSGRA